jgi:hypothetical protein
MVNELGYTVTNTDRGGGFITADKQRRGALLVLTGREDQDRLTVSIFDDSTSQRRKVRVTAVTISTSAGTSGSRTVTKAPSDVAISDANALLSSCSEGPSTRQSRVNVGRRGVALDES